jgi:uncharacterized protein (DUF885 family)
MNRWSRVLLAGLLSSSPLALGLFACGGSSPSQAPAATLPPTAPSPALPSPAAPAAPTAPTAPAAPTAEAQLDAFFEAHDRARLARSPQGQSYRAIKTDYDKWDDPSDEAAAAARAEEDAMLADLRARFSAEQLDPAHAMSYALFESNAARAASSYAFRDFGYVFDQMNGAQSGLPAFLINIHKVDTRADLDAYVRRLEGLGPTLRKYVALAQRRAAKGVSPPRWVYPFVISDATNVITGAPFDARPDSALFSDFKTKLAALRLPEADAAALTAAARAALVDGVAPAYRELIAAMKALEQQASTDDGVWRLARGAEYYAERLRSYTTTAMTADEIHALGLREVARIHGEMRALMPALGFRGKALAAFLRTMRDRKDLYFPSGEAGRAQYLSATQTALAEITAKLPQWFATLPKAKMEVKAVEAFREKSAGKAFYQRPAPDGSRPGTYYVNLYDMAAMPITEVEALAYHEGIPGHHLQLAIQTELGDLPPFRKFGGVTAYSEGWGLYAEKLAKEMGQYTDPLRDFGRLQLELHRAIRLVVDTGLHHKKWKKAQAIKYIIDSSAEPVAAATKAIERYIVFPGQATAYMIGRLKISELRDRAAAELGKAFDVRAFHDVVLRNGPIPLDVMEQEVLRWIASRKQG